TMTGRFLHLLDAADQARMAEAYAGLPTMDSVGVAMQLGSGPSASLRTPNCWDEPRGQLRPCPARRKPNEMG
ncbi:MAG: hypothetical protein ACRDTF_20695, partial [Pseudonocardiaceae bacterium]